MISAHPSIEGIRSGSGSSGSTAWNNSVRSRLYLTRYDKTDLDLRKLTNKKSNYGPLGIDIDLRWDGGVFKPLESGGGVAASILRPNCEAKFLSLLRKMAGQNRYLSESKNAANNAPRQFSRDPDREGYSKKDFELAMESLFEQGRIAVETYGRPSDLRKRIVEMVR